MFVLKKRFWLLFVLLLSAIFVVRAIPAAWVVSGLQQALPGLNVQGVTGTLWQGQIDRAVWQQRGEAFPVGRVNWSLHPFSLLLLSPCFTLSARYAPQAISGELCYSLLGGDVSATDVDITLPLDNVSPLLEVDLRGNIEGLISDFVWDGERFARADMNLLWQRAEVNNGSAWVPLGDLQARGSANDSGGLASTWSSTKADRAPPIAINLQTVLTPGTQEVTFTANGSIRLTAQTRSLRPMLQFIADEVTTDTFRVNLNETL